MRCGTLWQLGQHQVCQQRSVLLWGGRSSVWRRLPASGILNLCGVWWVGEKKRNSVITAVTTEGNCILCHWLMQRKISPQEAKTCIFKIIFFLFQVLLSRLGALGFFPPLFCKEDFHICYHQGHCIVGTSLCQNGIDITWQIFFILMFKILFFLKFSFNFYLTVFHVFSAMIAYFCFSVLFCHDCMFLYQLPLECLWRTSDRVVSSWSCSLQHIPGRWCFFLRVPECEQKCV